MHAELIRSFSESYLPSAGSPSTQPMSACAGGTWSGSGAGSRARCPRATTPCAPGAPSSSG
eukprot:12127156-Alexandrium_andersonii.AAC.1